MSDFELLIIRLEIDAMEREVLEKLHASIDYKNGYADACDELKEFIKRKMKENI